MEDPGSPFEPWIYPCAGGVEEDPPATHLTGPVDFLHAVRPSPFNARATIRFNLAQSEQAKLTIYDLSGRRVRQLVDGALEAGEHSLVWDARDDDAHPEHHSADLPGGSEWSLRSLPAGVGYAAAVAVEGTAPEYFLWEMRF